MLTSAYLHALTDALLDQDPEFAGVYAVQSGRFVHLNPAGAALLGYTSPAEFLASAAELPVRETSTGAAWLALLAAATAPHYAADVHVWRRDGSSVAAALQLSAFEADGLPYRIVRLCARTEERLQRAERELAQSVNRFEAVVANATIGIVLCNRRGQIVSANRVSEQQFGYEAGELVGQAIEMLVPRDVAPRHEQLRESFNAHPSVRAMGAHSGDLRAQRKDGSVFPVEVSLSYFHLDSELYVVSYILDITYKKEAERELIAQRQRVEALNAELEQKVADRTHALLSTLEQLEQRSEELTRALAVEQELGELKSRFVSMASHEFRTPLTAVLTSATLIEKYPGGDQQDKRLKHLQRIRASVNHLNDILEEFLSVGKIEEGKIEARPVELDIAALCAETVADLQGMLKAGQRIEQHVDCAPPAFLDPSLLRKILVNLLSNAVKYSGEGSVVTLRASCSSGQLTVHVQDQGVGIAPEDQEHLFERFFRARSVANIPGTGLGLYIVGRYLELMGGTIALRSALQQGTTLTVTIPYEIHPAD